MRTVDYVLLAVKDLRRQHVRSLLTIVALAISTIIVVTLAAISIGGQRVITDQFDDASLTAITVTPNQAGSSSSPFGGVQQVNAAASKLTDDTMARLSAVSGVTAVSPRVGLWEFRQFSVDDDSRQFVAQAWGVPFDNTTGLVAGRGFISNEESDVVIIGSQYARELALTPQDLIGKKITVTTQKGYRGQGAVVPPANASRQAVETFNQTETTISATIIGVTDGKLEQNGLFTSLGWARQIRTAHYAEATGMKEVDQLSESGYTTIRLRTDDTSQVTAAAAKIRSMGYGTTAALDQLNQLQQFSGAMWAILGSVALIAAIAAALGVANTMLMTVSEQQYIIGIWRAVGACKSMILRMIIMQAVVLGSVGGLIGIALGSAVTYGVDGYVSSLLEVQGLGAISLFPIPGFVLLGGVVATVLFALLASVYPAYKAARLDPSAALTGGR